MTQIAIAYGNLKRGDIVTLRSGGPDMTIIGFEVGEPVHPDNVPKGAGVQLTERGAVARCAWHTEGSAVFTHLLPVEALVLKDDGERREERRDPLTPEHPDTL